MGMSKWLVPLIGFAAGGIFLRLIDKTLPHLHPSAPEEQPEGIKTSWHKSTLLFLTLTMHNLPEGIAIGVAFGAAAANLGDATLAGAIALAIGIGIQDYPEGFSVAMPLRRVGKSMRKSFFYGTLSGIVEPLGALIGAASVMVCQSILPYALSFAAGAMVFVTVEEVIPEAESGGNADIATTGIMIGFALMMVLEVAFAG
jgi:ZIP family zinc transporter